MRLVTITFYYRDKMEQICNLSPLAAAHLRTIITDMMQGDVMIEISEQLREI